MKKQYSAPALSVIALDMEQGVLSVSLEIGTGSKVTEEGQVLSTGDGGWDSSNWAPAEPETK